MHAKRFFSQSIPEIIQVNAARGRNENRSAGCLADQAPVSTRAFFTPALVFRS